jgi:hypothetical protein
MCSELARLSRIIRELNAARARTRPKEPRLKMLLDDALLLVLDDYNRKKVEREPARIR